MATPSDPTVKQSGIITNADGTRSVVASVRADGSVRREIKIRPGYTPPEDVEKYRNRTAEGFRNRGKGGVLGAELVEESKSKDLSTAANKNAKRREARRRAAAGKSVTEDEQNGNSSANGEETENVAKGSETVGVDAAGPKDEEAERAKEAKKLAKKLRQAKELKSKQQSGDALIPDQLAKIVKINELMRQLNALGFNEDGNKKENDGETKAKADDPGEGESEKT